MNYKKIYDQLVAKAKIRGLDKSSVNYYTEIHHIVPKSLGGSDDNSNLVMFTGREHFIAHMLLWKAYPEEISLMRAAFMMSSRWQSGGLEESRPIHSRTYSILREEYAEAVKVQCSGEGNPFYGKTHSEETLARISQTKKDSFRKRSLKNWKANNKKYMAQYVFKINKPEDFLENIGKDIPSLHGKYDRDLWLKSEYIKDFWERSGKPEKRLLSTDILKVSGIDIPHFLMKTMIPKFKNNWIPSSDPSFIIFALNNYSKENNRTLEIFEKGTSKTLKEIENEYFSDWMKNRDINRNKIVDVLNKLEIVQHKNSIGDNSTLSLIDAAEANILWKSNLVQKKTIADLLGVRPNTISQSTSKGLRWKEITSNIDLILKEFYSESEYSRPPVEIPG